MVKLYVITLDILNVDDEYTYENEKRNIYYLNKKIKEFGLKLNRGDLISTIKSEDRYRNNSLYIWDACVQQLEYNYYLDDYGYLPSKFILSDAIGPFTYLDGIEHNSFFWPTLSQRQEIVDNLRYGSLFTETNMFYSFFTYNGVNIPFVLDCKYLQVILSKEIFTKLKSDKYAFNSKIKSNMLFDDLRDFEESRNYCFKGLNEESLEHSMSCEEGILSESKVDEEGVVTMYATNETYKVEDVEDYLCDSFLFDSIEYENAICSDQNNDIVGSIQSVGSESYYMIDSENLVYMNVKSNEETIVIAPIHLESIKKQILNMLVPFSRFDEYDIKQKFEFVSTFRLVCNNHLDMFLGYSIYGTSIEYAENYHMFNAYYSSLGGGAYI